MALFTPTWFFLALLRPGRVVQLCFSGSVKLWNGMSRPSRNVYKTAFSVPKTLAKNPCQKSGQTSGQQSDQKFGHADHVLTTALYWVLVSVTSTGLFLSCLLAFFLSCLLAWFLLLLFLLILISYASSAWLRRTAHRIVCPTTPFCLNKKILKKK